MPMPTLKFQMKAQESGELEILVHDEIGSWGISAKDFIKTLKDTPKASGIHLRINSPGGEVFEGNAIYNELLSYGVPIRATIDSLAASMASVLAMAADPGKIAMPENAMYMIHNPLIWIGGDAETLRKYADILDKLKEGILSAYMRHAKNTTREQMSAIMDAETWMSAAEAKEIGFADEILNPTEKEDPKNSARARVAECKVKVLALAKPENKPQPVIVPPPQRRVGMKFNEQGDLVDETGKVIKTKAQMEGATAEARAKEIAEAQAKARDDEHKRIVAIRAMCAGLAGCDEKFVNELTAPTVTIEAAQAKVLEKVKAGLSTISVVHHGDESDKMRDGLTNVMLVAGKVEKDDAKVAEANKSEFAAIRGLQNLVRFFAVKAGRKDAQYMDAAACGTAFVEMLFKPKAAMGMNSNDLESVLSNTAGISLLKGLREAPSTYQAVCAIGELPDLKSNEMYKQSEGPDVLEIPEGQAPKMGVVSDKHETAKLKKMGRAYSVTEEMIINDRLDIITKLPELYGRAITREQNFDFWSTLLTGNGPTLNETGRALFNATDGNQAAAGSAIGETTLAAGFSAMMMYTMLSPDGGQSKTQRVSLAPRRLCVGPRNALLANKYTADPFVPGKTSSEKNFFNSGDWALSPIIEPLIQVLIPATNAWLLALDPNDIEYAKMFTLAGRNTPRTMSRVGQAGEVKGFIFDIEHYWKVSLLDYRGWYKNVGVA